MSCERNRTVTTAMIAKAGAADEAQPIGSTAAGRGAPFGGCPVCVCFHGLSGFVS
jgi:hypothetical protein